MYAHSIDFLTGHLSTGHCLYMYSICECSNLLCAFCHAIYCGICSALWCRQSVDVCLQGVVQHGRAAKPSTRHNGRQRCLACYVLVFSLSCSAALQYINLIYCAYIPVFQCEVRVVTGSHVMSGNHSNARLKH